MKKDILPSLTFITPAYRDELTIEDVVRREVEIGKKVAKTFDVVVVDDASPDATGSVLDKIKKTIKNLTVIHHTKNAGYGGTIKELYYKGKGEWLFSIPGDYQYDPEQITALLPFTNSADMILGRRRTRGDTPMRKFQSKVYNFLLQTLYGVGIKDINTIRLLRRCAIPKELTTTSAFVDAELTIRMIRSGKRVIEVPIEHKERPKGVGAGGKWSIIWPTIKDMVGFLVKPNTSP